MSFKRTCNIARLFVLKKLGLLKKLPVTNKGVRISKTCMPDGSVIDHGGFVKEAPLNRDSFKSELHIFHEIKKSVTFNN
jgi:hypothetical protein